MAIQVRKGSGEVEPALVASYNAMRKTEAVVGSYFHADVTSTTSGDYTNKVATAYTVTAADATSIGTVKTLANDIKLKYNTHLADAIAHKVADTTHVVSTAAATDQTTANALLNALKAAYNLHRASTTYHYTADSTNTVTATDAVDPATSWALANEIKSAFNAHIAGAPGGSSLDLVDP